MKTCIRAFARIHLGFYTYPPNTNPWRGSGIYLSSPHVTVCITDGNTRFPSCISTEQKGTIKRLLGEEAGVEVHGCIPPHRGLGSSTQLYLATAKALALYKRKRFYWKETVWKLGRFKTSRVGALLYKYGGLVIDGSQVVGDTLDIKPFYHANLPRDWTVILVDPGGAPGPKEDLELNIWDSLPATSRDYSGKGEQIVKTMIYAANAGDLNSFTKAAVKLDRLTGEYFSTINPEILGTTGLELVNELNGEGITLMQSSWGPTLYTITRKRDAAETAEIIREVSSSLGFKDVKVSIVTPRNKGALRVSS